MSRPALGPVRSHYPIEYGAFSLGIKQLECDADTQLNLIPRLIRHGTINPLSLRLDAIAFSNLIKFLWVKLVNI
jgi:hypothetical protein